MAKLPSVTSIRERGHVHTVLLVIPNIAPAVTNATANLQTTIDILNSVADRSTPGFRFAPNVTARLKVVHDASDAKQYLSDDPNTALVILHGLPEQEKLELTKLCNSLQTGVAHTYKLKAIPIRQEPITVKFVERSFAPRASEVDEAALLTAPAKATADHIAELKRVIALEVMQSHAHKTSKASRQT